MSSQTEFADKVRVAVASLPLPRRFADGVEVREVSGGFEAIVTGRGKVLRGFDSSAEIAVRRVLALAKRNSN
jgi:hypothetical protein